MIARDFPWRGTYPFRVKRYDWFKKEIYSDHNIPTHQYLVAAAGVYRAARSRFEQTKFDKFIERKDT
ncbi:hypothetical protein ACROYT_G044419 [Oculina patagonica]